MGASLNMRGLAEILAGLAGEVEAAEKETAEDVRDLAAQLAPKDEGDLAESGLVEQTADGHQVVFGRGLPDIRAVAQEFGTVYQDAQPYLTPAAQETDPAFRLRKRLEALIARSGT